MMDSCRVTANHETEDDDEDKARQHENNDMTMTEEGGKPQTLDGDLQDPGEQEEEDEGNSEFNEDLLCEHGKKISIQYDVVHLKVLIIGPSAQVFLHLQETTKA